MVTRSVAWSIWLGLLAACGCEGRPELPPAALPPPDSPELRMTSDAPPGPEARRPAASFAVFCDVFIVECPAGFLSANAALWRHVNEEFLDVEEVDHLRRNGLRLGAGRAADLGPVLELIRDTRDKELEQARLLFTIKSAWEVFITHKVRPRQTFVFGRDGSLSGEDQAGVSILWVQAWHDIERANAVNLTLVPEIRWGRVVERAYSPTLERAAQYRDVGRLFEEVKVDLTLGRGEFLVIAPNMQAKPETILGRALLSEPRGGPAREKTLLICPRVELTPGP